MNALILKQRLVVALKAMLLVAFPSTAHAQYVPVWLAAAALSPLLALVFAVILGFVSRSWRVGLMHAGLVMLWVALFVIAAQLVENDYVIWTPIVLYAAHALLMLVLIVARLLQRT